MKIKKFDQFKQINEFYTGENESDIIQHIEALIQGSISNKDFDNAEDFAKLVENTLKKYFNKTTLGWKVKEDLKINENHLDENPSSIEDICAKIDEKYPNGPTAYDLASYCFEEYNFVTGRPTEERNDEGYFPNIFYDLMEHYHIDEDDFQNEWTDYAYDDSYSDDDDSIEENFKNISK